MNHEIARNSTPEGEKAPFAGLSPEAIPKGFTPAKALAIAALLQGKTKTAAAQMAGVTRFTVHGWLTKDLVFIAFYNSCRAEMLESVGQTLVLLSADAVRVQRSLLRSRKTPSAVKARVAADVIRQLPKEIDGPKEVDDAAIAIGVKISGNRLSKLKAALGLDAEDPDHWRILERVAPDKLKYAKGYKKSEIEGE